MLVAILQLSIFHIKWMNILLKVNDSENYAKFVAQSLDIPVLLRADMDFSLKDNQLVTIDPEKALVYNRIFADTK